MKPVRVTAPSAEPVTLADLKVAARVDFSDDDEILKAYLAAAVDHLDGWSGILGRAIIDQDWKINLGSWPAVGIVLPFGDVSDADITYIDPDENELVLGRGEYEVVETATGSMIRFRDSFSRPALFDDASDAVRVTFTTGFGPAATDVPSALRVAIMLLAAHWYEHREGAQGTKIESVPPSVDRLITPYRRVFF